MWKPFGSNLTDISKPAHLSTQKELLSHASYTNECSVTLSAALLSLCNMLDPTSAQDAPTRSAFTYRYKYAVSQGPWLLSLYWLKGILLKP